MCGKNEANKHRQKDRVIKQIIIWTIPFFVLFSAEETDCEVCYQF